MGNIGSNLQFFPSNTNGTEHLFNNFWFWISSKTIFFYYFWKIMTRKLTPIMPCEITLSSHVNRIFGAKKTNLLKRKIVSPLKKLYKSLGWSARNIQRWTALFQRFDVFQRCSALIQKTWKKSALFLTWAALTFSESALFRTDFFSSKISGFQRWTALIYSESFLILTHENKRLW